MPAANGGRDQQDLQGATTMTNDLRRTAASILGALLLTTTFVGAAVAPAHAVEAGRAAVAEAKPAAA